MKQKNKKGQITIFVVLAVVIMLSIGIIFYVKTNPVPEVSPSEDPKGYMRDCISDALDNAELKIIPHGGFANPTDSIKFDSIDVAQMCWTNENEKICSNKHPMLKTEIEKEILNLIKPKIENCFNDIKAELAKYNYKEEELSLSVEIVLDKIQAKVSKKITFSKNEQAITLSNFDSSINSRLYYFDKLSREIINQEVSCNCLEETCNADLTALNRFNRDFEISKPVYGGDGQEVYSIKEILTGKQFNFAIRNCVRLP